MLWGIRVSCGVISNLNKKTYVEIEAWRNAPITGEHSYVYLDGIVMRRPWGGGIELIASDTCRGLVQSVAEARWQRCVVHFYRNVFSDAPKTNAGGWWVPRQQILPGPRRRTSAPHRRAPPLHRQGTEPRSQNTQMTKPYCRETACQPTVPAISEEPSRPFSQPYQCFADSSEPKKP